MMRLLFRSLYSFFFLIFKTRYVHFLLLGFNISLRKFFSLKSIKTIPYIFLLYILYVFASLYNRGFPGGASSKETPANAADTGDVGVIAGREDPPEEEAATHTSIPAWSIPWTEESKVWQRARHN